jgi:hypothetical protein
MSRAVELESSLAEEPSRVEARAEAVPVARAGRWLALDLFRFCAVCLMVQGHVFSTLLDRATKSQDWYPHHSFVHGYTAPMFLFGAGLAFGYTTFRKWDDHAAGGAAARKRFKRYFWLLVIGYGLHLPTLSLRRLWAIDDPERIARMLQVDVLQHIGVSLALAQILVWLVKRREVFVGIVATLGAFCVSAAPWVWGVDLSDGGVPVWLAGYVNASTGSIFPILPWAGFTYTGIVIAYAIGVGGAGSARSVSARVSWPFAALAAAFMILPVVADRFGPYPWPPHNFWKTNPFFFFWRLGNVMAVLAVLCFGERLLARLGWLDAAPESGLGRFVQRGLPWVKLVGAESLIIYVVHLVALHGSVVAPGIKHSRAVHAHSEGLWTASVVTLLLFGAMVLLAKLWNELKKHPTGFAAVQLALVSVVVFVMLTGR